MAVPREPSVKKCTIGKKMAAYKPVILRESLDGIGQH